MPSTVILVKAARDAEAGVWFIESADVPGLNLEAETLEELVEKLPGAVLDLLDASDGEAGQALDMPIELIAHASTRVHRTAA